MASLTCFEMIEKNRFKTRAPFRFELGTPYAGMYLEVPEGFIFEVSVPKILHWLVHPRDSRFLEAAALHDFALSLGWPREVAAAPFGHSLRQNDVSRLKRLLVVLAVITWRWK